MPRALPVIAALLASLCAFSCEHSGFADHLSDGSNPKALCMMKTRPADTELTEPDHKISPFYDLSKQGSPLIEVQFNPGLKEEYEFAFTPSSYSTTWFANNRELSLTGKRCSNFRAQLPTLDKNTALSVNMTKYRSLRGVDEHFEIEELPAQRINQNVMGIGRYGRTPDKIPGKYRLIEHVATIFVDFSSPPEPASGPRHRTQ